jgi:uncharacterized glyoxalase superfamily protein PhnB
MKVTIDIDCTPEEARRFLGLPDLDQVHQATLDAMTERMRAAANELDAEAMLKSWLPGGVKGLEELQKTFWAGFAGAAKDGKDEKA